MLKIAPPRLPRRVKIEDLYAGMAELADAHGSGPCESNFMEVQVLLSAPNSRNPNLVPIGEGFGFLLYLNYPNLIANLKNANIEISGDKTLTGFISFYIFTIIF